MGESEASMGRRGDSYHLQTRITKKIAEDLLWNFAGCEANKTTAIMAKLSMKQRPAHHPRSQQYGRSLDYVDLRKTIKQGIQIVSVLELKINLFENWRTPI